MATEGTSAFTDKWQQGKSVTECLRFSLQNKILCDVIFIVGQERKRIEAHRLILSLRSPVFLAMMTGLLSEQDNISIPDIEPDIFEAFLTFMYTDDVIINGSNVTGLLYASKKYEITDLSDKCLAYMESSLTSRDVCVVLEQAHLYAEENLMKKCLTFIWKNGDDVLKSDSFSDLCSDCFRKIIETDDLAAKEETVFEASIAWSDNICRQEGRVITPENRRQALVESIHMIRFPIMDPQYFEKEVSPKQLLTESEEIKILKFFLYSNSDVSPFNSNKRRNTSNKEYRISRFAGFSRTNMLRSGNIDEGIVFKVNMVLSLLGFEMYGNPDGGQFAVSAFVCDLTNDCVLHDSYLSTQINSSDETFLVKFSNPLLLAKDREYKLSVRIKGKTVFEGRSGKNVVEVDSFKCFFGLCKECKHSGPSRNGTSVMSGQIPLLIFVK